MTPDIDKQMAGQFDGNFLDAVDLAGKEFVTVTISDVVAPNQEHDAKKKLIDKTIIAFKGKQKRMIVNKTNLKVIKWAHGPKVSAWVDKDIVLTVRYLKEAFGNKNVPVLRVVPPEGKSLPVGMRKAYGSATPFSDAPREPGE